MAANPYDTDPELMRERLSDPLVNTFEHSVNWLRFQALLPDDAARVLDFGCGAGNFTTQLAERYEHAYVVGVDAAAGMLPSISHTASSPRFEVWDGTMPLEEDNFDLVVAKMSLQYVDETAFRAVVANLTRLMSSSSRLLISIPHPSQDTLLNEAKRDARSAYHTPGNYRREVGRTGLHGMMTHRSLTDWVNPFLGRLGRTWGDLVIDEPVDVKNIPKRLNILFLPVGSSEYLNVYEKLHRVTAGQGQEEVTLVDMNTLKGRYLTNGTSLPLQRTPLP